MKNTLRTICHKWRVDEQFLHFFVDDMSGFGVDEQFVHFHVRVGCSVTVDFVNMGRKIQWTIHVGRSVTRTRCTWTIHHSTAVCLDLVTNSPSPKPKLDKLFVHPQNEHLYPKI
jgi:hypothetical protein